MSLRRWLAENRLREHQTNRKEIRNLLLMAERDLEDASVEELSADRRFLIAYDAALTLSTIPLYCSGYATQGKGHHWLTFRLLPELMGEEFLELADYFDLCRTKRNVSTYDRGGQISMAEVEELTLEVGRFRDDVLNWMEENHPEFIAS